MPERYTETILKYLNARRYCPVKPRQLARAMGVGDEDYGAFRTAIKRLRDSGRVVMGAKNALMLPDPPERIVGFFRANPRGFGFVVPESPNAHKDLYVPAESTAGAMTGDLVVGRVVRKKRRGKEIIFSGEVVEILKRGSNRYVGTLQCADQTWFVVPDGKEMTTPIVIRDAGSAGAKTDTKVVTEIVEFAKPGELPVGVIVETLGEKGRLEIETLGVIRAYGLEDEFSAEAITDARAAVDRFDPGDLDAREDLTDLTVVTIDPPDARDFDDAISLQSNGNGTMTLGVHIADVSHFVTESGTLDLEARKRGNSVYFPRKVLPMLPEILSNGVCSLQEGVPRYCKSVFITYDGRAEVVKTRLAETVIRSTKRLEYRQAQQIIDGKTGEFPDEIVKLLQGLEKLSRRIESRRRKQGMLHLDLPEVELVFDEDDKVIDAAQGDDSYTHTMIEMFMVEANQGVSTLLHRLERPHLRRIHPAPDNTSTTQLNQFVRACGRKLPRDMTRRDIQELLETVKGKRESYAVNLAVLRTFQQAEYSPRQVGHFALACDHYTHFTSPIRRYPDLTVHRLVAQHIRGQLDTRGPEDITELTKLGQDCTACEKRAESAERELREVLLLQFLEGKVGETFDGVLTGVTNFGIFVELTRFGIDGLMRFDDLGDDWWDVSVRTGSVRGQRSGRKYRIGDMLEVRIADVDVARRQLNLVPAKEQTSAKQPGPKRKKQ